MNRYSPLKRTGFTRKRFDWRHGSTLKRSRLRARKFTKVAADDGASLRELKDEMDSLVRTIIALRDRKCVNFGCGKTEGLHVGHYIKRGVLALRWDLRNCNAQCDPCNEAHSTNSRPYRETMYFRYGIGVTQKIEELARQNPHVTYVELVAIRDGLRANRELREAA